MNVSFVHSFTTQQQQQSITSYFLSHPHHTTSHCTPHHHHRKTSFLLPPSTVTNQSTKQGTRTRTMPISWTPHMDQKLLLAVISSVRLDAEILVEKWRELFLGMCPPPISFSIVFVSLFIQFIHSSHWGKNKYRLTGGTDTFVSFLLLSLSQIRRNVRLNVRLSNMWPS